MIGLKHLGISIMFLIGVFLIDLEHKGLTLQNGWAGFIGKPMTGSVSHGILHTPLIFYILLALTLGVGFHLIMDRVKLK